MKQQTAPRFRNKAEWKGKGEKSNSVQSTNKLPIIAQNAYFQQYIRNK